MGDVGGFNDAVTLIFASCGAFFSARFVTAALAKDLFMEKNPNYLRKKKNREILLKQIAHEKTLESQLTHTLNGNPKPLIET